MSDEETGREYVVPEDPNDRPRKDRRTVRVVLISGDRTFLFQDSDPGLPDQRWWVTPGGGMDPGETLAETAIREIAEETGYRLAPGDLIGPVAHRIVQHGYSDQVMTCDEVFFLARVPTFELDTSAHTEEEQITLQQARWWSRDELATTTERIWPAELGELWDSIDDQQGRPRELGHQEESTRPV